MNDINLPPIFGRHLMVKSADEKIAALKDYARAAVMADRAERLKSEPIAWESTTSVYIKYITDARYRKFRPGARRWYRPYRCCNCAANKETKKESK